MEEALANLLQIYVDDPEYARVSDPMSADQIVRQLNSQLLSIKRKIIEIRDLSNRIDPNSSINSFDTVADIGSFSHDGRLFYRTSFRQFPLTNQAVVATLVEQLRRESLQIRQYYRQLSGVLGRSQASPGAPPTNQ
jgi:hypothetical protein